MQKYYILAVGPIRSGHGEKWCNRSTAVDSLRDLAIYGTADEESAIRVAGANGRDGHQQSASARWSLFWAVKCDRPPLCQDPDYLAK
jgi:hypothetical protein